MNIQKITAYITSLNTKDFTPYEIQEKLDSLHTFLNWIEEKKLIPHEELKSINNILSDYEKSIQIKRDNKISHQKNIYRKSLIKYSFFFTIIAAILGLAVYGIIIYTNTIFNAEKPLNNNIISTRTLIFKGKLTNDQTEPIESKTDVIFTLYENNNKTLYQGKCLGADGVIPEVDGTFEIKIGSDCKMEGIPESIFKDNTDLYLGLKIDGKDITPLKKIPNVAFSKDTEKISGMKIGTEKETIPFIDSTGTLLMTADSPTIKSTEGILNISAEQLVFSTSDKNKGDIILQPYNDSHTIIPSGNLALGTYKPNHKLTVMGSNSYGSIVSINNLTDTDDFLTSVLKLNTGASLEATSAAFIQFFAEAKNDTDGIYVGSIRLNNQKISYETGGADYAELFDIKEPTENGHIISLTNNDYKKAQENESLIGVISDQAGFIGNVKKESDRRDKQIVGLLGQVDTFVSTINGPIKKGDRLTASLIPGYGKRQTYAGEIIGKSLQNTDKIDEEKFNNQLCPPIYQSLTDEFGQPIRCGKVTILLSVSWYGQDE